MKGMKSRSKTLDSVSQKQTGKFDKSSNNQKKTSNLGPNISAYKDLRRESGTGNKTKFSSKIFKGNEYMKQFILEVKSDKYSFKCTKFRDENGKPGKILLVNSLKVHLLSEDHKNNTPLKELDKYEQLRDLFEDKTRKKNDNEEETTDKDSKNFLSFITYAMSQRLSFSQIEILGKYLQQSYKEKKLKFLSSSNFDQKFLSKLAQDCFKPIIEEDLKNKLLENPYSLIIDNSTFRSANVCALKVKYLEKEMDENLKTQITSVKNKIIALPTLKKNLMDRH